MSLTAEQRRRRYTAALKVAITACEAPGWCADCAGQVCPDHAGQFRLAEEFREALVELTGEAAPAGRETA